VVVAVVAVRVVQVAADEVIGVVAVGHGLVAAAGAVLVGLVVAVAGVGRRAGGRVGGADRQAVLLDAAAVGVVQVAVVQVIDVVFVLDGGVAAAGAVLVVVVFVRLRHASASFGPWFLPTPVIMGRPR
jgi:hypothetical protein